MIDTRTFPPEWNDWIAMLATKPGEDTTLLERRRDLWIQCHTCKFVVRMMNANYEEICRKVVPGSQAGFTSGMNAPAQTLVARLQAEQAMYARSACVRGYIDIATFFPALVQKVQWAVEKRMGVAPDVRSVMMALREGTTGTRGVHGRYETRYGLSPAFTRRDGQEQKGNTDVELQRESCVHAKYGRDE